MVQKVGLEGPKSLKSIVKVSLVRSLSPFGPFGLVVGAVWVVPGVCTHFAVDQRVPNT